MILLFQERKPVESNHFVCNAVGTEEVSNSFRDKKDDLNENIKGFALHTSKGINYHCWQNVRQSSCKFEHDDHNRNCDSHNTANHNALISSTTAYIGFAHLSAAAAPKNA
jgi:hypothetical protein